MASEEEQTDDYWEDSEPDAPEDAVKEDFLCLFCPSIFNSTEKIFHHITSKHDFDFHKYRKTNSLDFYDSVKTINYIRSHILQNPNIHPSEVVQSLNKNKKDIFQSEKYLKPTLNNDPLLYSFENDDEFSSSSSDDDDEDGEFLTETKENATSSSPAGGKKMEMESLRTGNSDEDPNSSASFTQFQVDKNVSKERGNANAILRAKNQKLEDTIKELKMQMKLMKDTLDKVIGEVKKTSPTPLQSQKVLSERRTPRGSFYFFFGIPRCS